jgi:hypothetical protein
MKKTSIAGANGMLKASPSDSAKRMATRGVGAKGAKKRAKVATTTTVVDTTEVVPVFGVCITEVADGTELAQLKKQFLDFKTKSDQTNNTHVKAMASLRKVQKEVITKHTKDNDDLRAMNEEKNVQFQKLTAAHNAQIARLHLANTTAINETRDKYRNYSIELQDALSDFNYARLVKWSHKLGAMSCPISMTMLLPDDAVCVLVGCQCNCMIKAKWATWTEDKLRTDKSINCLTCAEPITKIVHSTVAKAVADFEWAKIEKLTKCDNAEDVSDRYDEKMTQERLEKKQQDTAPARALNEESLAYWKKGMELYGGNSGDGNCWASINPFSM